MSQSDSDQIFEAVLALPMQERLRLVERVIHEMTLSSSPPTAPSNSVIGLFADHADLLDEVVDNALNARGRDPLRR